MTIALITGGNRGLGRASAVALARTGVDIVITWRSHEDEAQAVVADLRSLGRAAAALQLDTSHLETFADFEERLRTTLADTFARDTIDYLVNNAGFSGDTPFGDISAEVLDSLYVVHVKSVVLLTQQLAPLIADGGRVLNVSTGLTQILVNPRYSVYAAMKAAIEVWTRYLAKDLGVRGIAVNVIAPGATATDFAGGLLRDSDQYQAGITSTSALGRVGRADDIGGVVAAILAPDAGWMTGQRIEASGGQGMGRGIEG